MASRRIQPEKANDQKRCLSDFKRWVWNSLCASWWDLGELRHANCKIQSWETLVCLAPSPARFSVPPLYSDVPQALGDVLLRVGCLVRRSSVPNALLPGQVIPSPASPLEWLPKSPRHLYRQDELLRKRQQPLCLTRSWKSRCCL